MLVELTFEAAKEKINLIFSKLEKIEKLTLPSRATIDNYTKRELYKIMYQIADIVDSMNKKDKNKMDVIISLIVNKIRVTRNLVYNKKDDEHIVDVSNRVINLKNMGDLLTIE